jgi:hypothetical protein
MLSFPPKVYNHNRPRIYSPDSVKNQRLDRIVGGTRLSTWQLLTLCMPLDVIDHRSLPVTASMHTTIHKQSVHGLRRAMFNIPSTPDNTRRIHLYILNGRYRTRRPIRVTVDFGG